MERSAAAVLREARHRTGLTQHAIGARAGVPQSVISAYESGRREPSVPMLSKLVAATGHRLDLSLTPIDSEARPLSGPLSGRLGQRLHERRSTVAAVLDRYGVRGAAVFGSVARGDEGPNSDVDLLVDLATGTGLLALGQLTDDLERLLGARVDVVPREGLKPDVRARVERDAVPL